MRINEIGIENPSHFIKSTDVDGVMEDVGV